MSKVKKKKTIKDETWTCDIVYSRQETKDLIVELIRRIESEKAWKEILCEKKRLEEELSAVRIKILKRCINSSCRTIKTYTEKLKELEKPIKKQRKRQ